MTPRKSLPPLPPRIAALKVDDRGYPIPWFVKWIDGKPDFRVIDHEKMIKAVKFSRCWICGEMMGSTFCFVSGPIAAINRASGEPPSHTECGDFAARACPFLILPRAKRREAGLPEEAKDLPGAIKRNPGVACVWITKGYGISRNVFRIGDPVEVRWYAEGRQATRAEVAQSVEGGLSELRVIAEQEGEASLRALATLVEKTMRNLPGLEKLS